MKMVDTSNKRHLPKSAGIVVLGVKRGGKIGNEKSHVQNGHPF